MPAGQIPLFVDTDNTMGLRGREIDDGLAILYLVDRPEVSLVGVSTTHGNGSVDETTAATRALVDSLNEPVAVHRGGEEAARALVSASVEHEGRLVVLGLGALTNLALASKIDPDVFGRLAGIATMGGYLGPLRFPRGEVAELNFSADADAALTVLRAPCPVTIASAQLCLSLRFGARHLLTRNRGPAWLRATVRDWYRTFSRMTGVRGFYLWDLVPALAVLEPARVPSHRVRLRSNRDDLAAGRLVLAEPGARSATHAPAGGEAGTDAVDPRAPGVVSVPREIVGASRFVREAARAWNRAARRARGFAGGTPLPRNGV